MNGLLADVLEAHGGLARWNGYSRARATIVSGGALWGMKGVPQDATPRLMRVELHRQWASVSPYGAPDQLTDYTPDRIAIVKADGALVAERRDPRAHFEGHRLASPWDALDRAYFNGYALWTYLTTPFLLASPQVTTTEEAPWREGEESWRVLRAEFSPEIATHNPVQRFYFGDDGLLRRHDYEVEIAGGLVSAQMVGDYVEADGLMLPTRRRAYLQGPDGRPAPVSLMVSIDLSDIHFE
jgi:hypothetical protein